MATNWPTSRDTFTNPTSGDTLDSPSHAAQHANINDAVAAMQAHAGLVLVKPTSAVNGTVGANGAVTIGTTVSSVTVNGAFSSTFDNYRIIYNNGVSSTLCELQLRLGATSTGYYSSLVYTAWASPWTPLGTGASNGSVWTLGGAGDPDGNFMLVDVCNPYLARRTTVSGPFIGMDTDRGVGHMCGMLTNTTSYTAFTIIVSTGTITGGTIRVYGYNNG